MLGVAGAALGMSRAFARAAPGQRGLILHNGQSLSVGGLQVVPSSTTQPYTNGKLFDSSGTYDITNPNAGTLSRVPLVTPLRPIGAPGGPSYPGNIAGESLETSMANTITWLAKQWRYPSYDLDAESVGETSQPYSVVGRGGSGNNYAASLFVCRALKRLAGAISYYVALQVLTLGEADAGITPTATYLADTLGYQTGGQSDLQAITGQSRAIPLMFSQQNSSPSAASIGGTPTTAYAQWQAALASALCLLTGPKYQYEYDVTPLPPIHVDYYPPVGEKHAQAYLWWELSQAPYFALPAWLPFMPSPTVPITRSGLTVTIPFYVPVGPLVWDTKKVGPHLSGPFALWAAGKGFEAYDSVANVTAATNASPIVVTLDAPHGRTTGDTYVLRGCVGNTAATGSWTVTVLSPTSLLLNGSTGNGAYTTSAGAGQGFHPIGITAATIVGSTVQLTLAAQPIGGQGWVAYADKPDVGGAGFVGGGRCGLLRDSDSFRGPSRLANHNWCIQFAQGGL